MKFEVVILNYLGKEVLFNCVSSFTDNQKKMGFDYSIVVLENNSNDPYLDIIRKTKPNVKVIRTKKNDFLFSFNEYLLNKSKADIVALINNDVLIESGSLKSFVEVFEKNQDAFLAGPQIWSYGKDRYEGSKGCLTFRKGYLTTEVRHFDYNLDEVNNPGYIISSGPFMVFRRDRFLELGGFDRYYYPGRSEDMDIGYRGWKSGYKGYYVPSVKAYHLGSYTFNKEFTKKGNDFLGIRNQYKFMYKNISDKGMRFQMYLWLYVRLLGAIFLLKFGYVKMILNFIFFQKKVRDKKKYRFSDMDILNFLKDDG